MTLAGEHGSQQGLAWAPDSTSVSAWNEDKDQPYSGRQVYSVSASGRAPAKLLLDAPGGLIVNDINARGDVLAIRSEIGSPMRSSPR